MRVISMVGTLMLVAGLLSGCNTVSESDFKMGQAAVAESKTIRQAILKECMAKLAREPLTQRMNSAQFIGVSVARYPETMCRRALNAYANGRITYKDYVRLMNGEFDDKMVKIVKGG
ncbi:MAG: hypothetical protein ACRCU5_07415 [Rhizobiaceae bacterium]